MLSTPSTSVQDSSPARKSAPTYSNPRFGLSFRVPSNYTLIQGQGAGSRGDDFITPGDLGEYLFAKVERTTRYYPGPLTFPSAAALYFGVHLGISAETCLAPLSFPSYKSKGTVLLDGVTFHWSADPLPEKGLRAAGRSPFTEEYFRDYAGFANSVCYEFHLRTRTSARENALPDLEAVLSTIKIFPRSSAAHAVPGQPETPFPVPDEILGLMKFAPWQVTYPRVGTAFLPVFQRRTTPLEAPGQPPAVPPAGGTADLTESNVISFSYGSDLSDGDEATAAIAKLESQIIQYLEQHQWSVARVGRVPTSRPLQGSYQKDSAYLEMVRGTDRCTMNSPCTQYDILTITVNIPSTF